MSRPFKSPHVGPRRRTSGLGPGRLAAARALPVLGGLAALVMLGACASGTSTMDDDVITVSLLEANREAWAGGR